MAEIFICAAALIGTYAGVKLFIVWSLRRKVLDVPNERSSHTRPTPRGGGLIVVVAVLGLYFLYTSLVSGNFSRRYFAGGVLIAAVSWLDDLFSISFVWRILIHAAAAALFVVGLNEQTVFAGSAADSEAFGIGASAVAFLWIVWLTNAYNFMDGIDGIAALQAVCAGIGWFACGKILHTETAAIIGLITAFSSIGFLILNWQPAKVFMGDVGSAFLGFSFATLPLLAIKENAEQRASLIFIGVALVWLFFFDTLVTFLRRVRNGEKFWRAHRSHVYQRLTTSGFSHSSVAGLYGALSALNVFLIAGALLFYGNLFSVLFTFLLIQATALLVFSRRRGKRRDSDF